MTRHGQSTLLLLTLMHSRLALPQPPAHTGCLPSGWLLDSGYRTEMQNHGNGGAGEFSLPLEGRSPAVCKGRGGRRAKACQAESHSQERMRKLHLSPWCIYTERFDPVENGVLC